MWDFVMNKSGAGAGFLRELRFPLPIYIPSAFSTNIFTITRGWHNRPGVAAVPIASQRRIKKKVLILSCDVHAISWRYTGFFIFKDFSELNSVTFRIRLQNMVLFVKGTENKFFKRTQNP
jgi:hypothetical protein